MTDRKFSVLGVLISATTYTQAVSQIIEAAQARQSLTSSALAVHGVTLGVFDPQFRYRLNQFELNLPDGQPIRWALKLLYGVNLSERVYGPTLMLRLCETAAQQGIGIYFYGSEAKTLDALQQKLNAQFPGLRICGAEPSKFRRLSALEQVQAAEAMQASGAQLVFVGLGCPLQEIWAYEHRALLHMPVIAVGAAFDWISGRKTQAPQWMQDRGLEWLFRLFQEPRRLWRRYVLLNPVYLMLLLAQMLKLKRFDTAGIPAEQPQRYG